MKRYFKSKLHLYNYLKKYCNDKEVCKKLFNLYLSFCVDNEEMNICFNTISYQLRFNQYNINEYIFKTIKEREISFDLLIELKGYIEDFIIKKEMGE